MDTVQCFGDGGAEMKSLALERRTYPRNFLEVGARGGRLAGSRRKAPSVELLQLRTSRHLLGEQRGLDAVEEALEPPHELGLRDAQLGVGGRLVGKRQRELRQLVAQLWREALGELTYRRLVDLAEASAALVVERRPSHLFEELPDHRADAHDLGGLLDDLTRLCAVAARAVR